MSGAGAQLQQRGSAGKCCYTDISVLLRFNLTNVQAMSGSSVWIARMLKELLGYPLGTLRNAKKMLWAEKSIDSPGGSGELRMEPFLEAARGASFDSTCT